MRQCKKHTDRNKTKYAAKICGIMPRSHIRIEPAYGNGESDSLCGKICNMHTFGKYANNAATIAYSRGTDRSTQYRDARLKSQTLLKHVDI